MSETFETPQTEAQPNREEDPYCLKEYACDLVPLDGGDAPIQKTVEPEAYHDNRIYVSNIPFTFSDEDLAKLFSRFGHVKSAMIVCNERGSKGFGFVTMNSVDSCERARANLHGTRILGRSIEVRKATPLLKSSRLSHKQSSLSNSSPRRLAQTARMTISRSKKAVQQLQAAQIGVSPNVMSMGTMLPTLASQCMNPMTASIPQQSSMNLFLNENPVLLQSFLSSYALAAQTAFITPTSIFLGPNPFILPGAPLSQPQPSLAYSMATLPQQNFMSESSFLMCRAQQSVYYHDPTQTLFHGHGGSLNNSMVNGTLLSTLMNDPIHRMQDNLVNLLSLNGTIDQSKLVELQANSSPPTFDGGNSMAELDDSGRKRRADVFPEAPRIDSHGSTHKRFPL